MPGDGNHIVFSEDQSRDVTNVDAVLIGFEKNRRVDSPRDITSYGSLDYEAAGVPTLHIPLKGPVSLTSELKETIRAYAKRSNGISKANDATEERLVDRGSIG